MKNEENAKYLKIGVTAAAVTAFGILLSHLVANIGNFHGGLNMVLGILRAFVYGAVIAYLVQPLSSILEKGFAKVLGEKRKKTAFSLGNALGLVIAVVLVLAVLFLIVPQLLDSVIGIGQALPGQIESVRVQIDKALQEDPELLKLWDKYYGEVSAKVSEFLNGDLMGNVMSIVGGAAFQLASILGMLKDLLIGLIVALYILSKRKQLGAQANLVVRGALKPGWADWVLGEVRYADQMFHGFFMGKLLDSLIVGVICFVGCLLMGFASPLLIAVIVGITNIIPFFGPFIGAVPCALLLVLEDPVHCVMFLIFVVVLQQVDGNIIGPKILGDSTGLSALWVMFAILLFGGLWGIIGMLVGVPLMAVIYDVIRQVTFKGVRRNGMEELIVCYEETFHGGDHPAPEEKKA